MQEKLEKVPLANVSMMIDQLQQIHKAKTQRDKEINKQTKHNNKELTNQNIKKRSMNGSSNYVQSDCYFIKVISQFDSCHEFGFQLFGGRHCSR
jgi:hypothetical protein